MGHSHCGSCEGVWGGGSRLKTHSKGHLLIQFYFIVFYFEAGSHVAQVGLKLIL